MPFQGFPSRWKPGVCLLLHPRARLSVPFSIPSPMSSKHLVLTSLPLTIILTNLNCIFNVRLALC